MADARFDEKTLKRAEFCESKCTACKKSREKDTGFWHTVVKLEEKLCSWCRAYTKVHGVHAYENPPS